MIRFLTLEAADTFSYREVRFDFVSGLHSIEGANGSSKTSIFIALIHCLMNKNPKGCKVDDVSNKITCKPYEIKVAAEVEGRHYRFINSKKTGTVEIWRDGRDISLKRIPDNLKMIQEILGADFTLLCDLIYQSKDTTLDLLETGSDRGRKVFVNRVLKLAEVDEQAVRMKEKEKELAGKNGKIVALLSQIATLESAVGEMLEIEEEIVTHGTEAEISCLSDEIGELTLRQRQLEDELKMLQSQIAVAEGEEAIRRKIADCEALYSPSPLESIQGHQAQLEDVQAEVHALNINLSTFRNDLARAISVREQMDLLDEYRRQLADIPKPDKDKGECLDQLGKITRIQVTTKAKLEDVQKELRRYRQSVVDQVCPTCGSAENWERIQELVIQREAEETEFEELIRKCEGGVEKYNERLRLWERRERLETEIAKLAMVTPVDFDVMTAERRVQEYEKETEILKDKAAQIKAEIAQYHKAKEQEAEIAKLKAALKGIDLTEATFQRQAALQDELKMVAEARDTKLQRQRHLQDRLEKVKQHNASVRARLEVNRQIEEKNRELLLKIAQAKQELVAAENKLDCVKEWNGILGNKGFRVAKINRFLRLLNATMVKYSQMICNGRIRCVFFITPEGEIEFSISDSAKEMDYPLWSGGEKARIRMVCLFAVLELLEVMGSVSFNVLCLDEVFDQLDNDGKEGLFKVLEYLKQKMGKAIYVIAHSELTLDLSYDTVVRAIKHQDGTTEIVQ